VDKVIEAIRSLLSPVFDRLRAETVISFSTFILSVFLICYLGPSFASHVAAQLKSQQEHDTLERKESRDLFAKIIDQVERSSDRQLNQIVSEIHSLRDDIRRATP
jgi:hypothetical protein